MMYGMGNMVIIWSLLSLAIALGYALIIWILASKESGWVKMAGQIIAAAIAILMVVTFLYGGIYGRKMGKTYPMGKNMTGKDSEKMIMRMMKNNPEMQKKMMEQLKK
ncbi:MAG: hypothetical protein PHH14_05510 [Candidatus Margulisbacteria bacterium]|nr:hypothetical protein [Candidatus Margulisiibacteriota bacterium]